jgi:hypothetical protein
MNKQIIGLLMIVALLISSCDVFWPQSQQMPDILDIAEEAPAKTEKNDENDVGDEAKSLTETEAEEEVEKDDSMDAPPNETQVLNPLTGLPVSNPENLLLPPALVSVTNFPPTARPQAGLSFSPIVFELFIGDGMTRYLALFYGDYPRDLTATTSQNLEEELTAGMDAPMIGPVRSGRIPYEHIRKLYNGFIIMASAYSRVADQLNDFVNVFGSDDSDVNSAMVGVEDIEAIAKDNQDEIGDAALGGMEFSEEPPEGGKDAHSLWLYYAFKNQVFWRFNASDGTYHRWQDNADGETFIEQTDRLTGDPLTFENVIVLLVDHTVEQKYFIDLDLLYVEREKALVFRDGKVHEIYWTTKSEEYEQTTGNFRPIRFIDAEGNPFLLKPGQTWIELIPTHSPIWETVDSEKYHLLLNGRSKGSGYWAVWFAVDN